MKNTFALFVSLLAGAVVAAPQVADVTVSQADSRRVTVVYTLSEEPAIITADVLTNGVSVGGRNLACFAGDVSRLVQPGSRSLTWRPDRSWPDCEPMPSVDVAVRAWSTNAPPDYAVLSLVAKDAVRYFADAESVPGGVTNDAYKTDEMLLRRIPAGNVEWRMGSVTNEVGRANFIAREVPHMVTLSNDFYIGVYEVTQRQYEHIMGSRPAYYNNNDYYRKRPVENVAFNNLRGSVAGGFNWPNDGHAVASYNFLGKLRSFVGLTLIDLPLEAQWEFACRAGSGSALYNGMELENDATSARADALARNWSTGKINGQEPAQGVSPEHGTAEVGSLEPNSFGLYDMLGNVQEFCRDWYEENNTGCNSEIGPSSSSSGSRVIRGGSWGDAARYCRCASRAGRTPTTADKCVGFRVWGPVPLR